MVCKGMAFYYKHLPPEFEENIIKETPSQFEAVREHVVCKMSPKKCPKCRQKCRISQYCYMQKSEC